jgi:hypothetical protein
MNHWDPLQGGCGRSGGAASPSNGRPSDGIEAIRPPARRSAPAMHEAAGAKNPRLRQGLRALSRVERNDAGTRTRSGPKPSRHPGSTRQANDRTGLDQL